jgi:hypothetical protein
MACIRAAAAMFWLTSSWMPPPTSSTSASRAAATRPTAAVAGGRVERHVAAEEERRIQEAEHHVGVGDGGLGAAAGVARRARFGARRFGPHLQQPEVVGAGDAAAARPDLHQVDRRHHGREAGALLEAVDAGDLEVGGQLRLGLAR